MSAPVSGAPLIEMGDGAGDARDAELLAAHHAGDGAALARLYRAAGLQADALGDTDRACFLITMAYVNALDAGIAETARELHDWLVVRERDMPD